MAERSIWLWLAALSGVLMATIGVISRKTGLAAETITFFRLFLGAVLLALWLLMRGRIHQLGRPCVRMVVNGVLLAGFIICYVQAMNYTSMANAIMMIYTAPVLAAVGAHWLLGERLRPVNAALIGLALTGFAMMMEFRLDLAGSPGQATGLLLGAGSTLCYAGFMLINRTFPAEIPPLSKTFWQMATGALFMLPLMLLAGDSIAGWQLPWLLGAGLLPGFLGILFAVMALQHLPAATFGTLAYLEPIAVILFGWLIFGETLSSLQLAGCTLIIGAGLIQGWLASRPAPLTTQTEPAR